MAAVRVNCVTTERRGRILVSKTDFQRGESIICEEPYAFILSNKKRGILCDSCLRESSSPLQRCSGCKFVRYCSRFCQKEDWSRAHKLECPCLKRVLPKLPPGLARLLAQLWWKQKNQGGDVARERDPGGFPSTLDQLETHHEILSAERKEHFESLLVVLQQYLGQDDMPQSQQLLQIFGAVLCNSFSICDNDLNGIGVGIYMRASMLNHSCDPSCVVVFDGRQLQLRTVKEVKKGDECTISYVDLLTSESDCQAELQERYHFTCECRRCQSPSEAWTTSDCNNEIESRLQRTLKEVEEANTSQDWSAVKKLCEPFLHMMKTSDDLPPNHHLVIKLRDAAFDACIESQDWEKAATYGQDNTASYKHHYGPYHPSLGVHLLKVGKLLLYLEKLPDAIKYLRQAEDVLTVTHGQRHPLMSTLKELLASCR